MPVLPSSGFPNWGRLVGGQFGQNGQKPHENYKIGIFGSKQWGEGGDMGGKSIFRVLGGIPPQFPPLGETLLMQKPVSGFAQQIN